ncbi:thyroid transcription factor 1-associated protein 26 [Sipha flava]|uniref:Thyroid transcription factor 1-associated protein 26 n=1 Tax=Sipha flava TaxID=143950 RepID=A0A8B8FWR9_9HEMI|nr:thyroid transcription factor 1-associated protein 26 [Sipha flava]
MSSKIETSKKPFDKKKWRTKKYSKKHKFQEWDERRKKAIIRDYYKDLNKSGVERPLDTSINDDTIPIRQLKRLNPHKEAQERYKQILEEKKARRFEASKKKEEIRQALEEYKKKKIYRNKKLGKKTKKGQPVMKERLELLLEKIQASVSNNV